MKREKIYMGKKNVVFKQGGCSTIKPQKGTIIIGRALDIEGKRIVTSYEINKVYNMSLEHNGFASWRFVRALVDEFYYADEVIKLKV